MLKLNRSDCPDYLQQNKEAWTNNYISKYNISISNKGATFSWPTLTGKKLNHLLLVDLAIDTAHHCSFCDNHNFRDADITIEHFYPKANSIYLQLAYDWHNLFYSCFPCNKSKLEIVSELLLKPDALDYNFEKYFWFDYTDDYHLKPMPKVSKIEKQKAQFTIDTFKLNEKGLRNARRIAHNDKNNL